MRAVTRQDKSGPPKIVSLLQDQLGQILCLMLLLQSVSNIALNSEYNSSTWKTPSIVSPLPQLSPLNNSLDNAKPVITPILSLWVPLDTPLSPPSINSLPCGSFRSFSLYLKCAKNGGPKFIQLTC